jgi:Protein of unknown function (DUF2815)
MAKIKAGLKGETVTTPVLRLSYPHLFEAFKNEDDDPTKKPKFSAAFLAPLDAVAEYGKLGLPPAFAAGYDALMKAMKLAIFKLAIEAYGSMANLPEEIRNQSLRKGNGWPFRDQGQKEGEGYTPGALFFNCSSERRPQVLDQALRRILPLNDRLREALGREGKLSPKDPEDVYAGCWVRASVRPFSYFNKGNEGISLGLGNVQLVCDDTPLGGGGGAEGQFEAIGGSASASDDDLADLLGA